MLNYTYYLLQYNLIFIFLHAHTYKHKVVQRIILLMPHHVANSSVEIIVFLHKKIK